MSRSVGQLELDDALLRAVDAAAERSGRTRREVLDDSVRRGLAAGIFGEVLARVRSSSKVSADQAAVIADEELRAARAARRAAIRTPDDRDEAGSDSSPL